MAQEMMEIRWHARGGQGAKTAATLVAMVALEEGKYSQGFPEYGPERMGAPVKGYTRISDKPISVHCNIDEPDVEVVLDVSLLDSPDVADGPHSVILQQVNNGLAVRMAVLWLTSGVEKDIAGEKKPR